MNRPEDYMDEEDKQVGDMDHNELSDSDRTISVLLMLDFGYVLDDEGVVAPQDYRRL